MGSRRRVPFGQHFLERAWAENLVRVIAPKADDVFLEIGPGRGALTFALASASARVLAFEIDRRLAARLSAAAPPKLKVVEGDFLDVSAERVSELLAEAGQPGIESGSLRVAGNLPYNVASPILFKLIELYRAGLRLGDVTVMLQREVADRLLAPPGNRVYGVLSILVRRTARVERLMTLPPGAFRPVPKVDSTVVRLVFHPDDPPGRSRAAFEALVQSVFTRRRKTLANALLAFLPEKAAVQQALARSGIDGSRRPEALDIGEFVRMADAFDHPP
jgi:16S rRNA (adenine1518-N6/adenine1519-N6)-dimethyltransferase